MPTRIDIERKLKEIVTAIEDGGYKVEWKTLCLSAPIGAPQI